MKKLVLVFISLLLSLNYINAQTTQTAESLLKLKVKSDKDIENPKKNVKASTWLKRGNLMLDLIQFNTKGLWRSMPQKGITGAEVLVGKPNKITTLKNEEDWIYDHVTLKFKDGKLDSWEETKPLVENGLDLAYEAYFKAWELDQKGKGKLKKDKEFLADIAILRGLYANKGVRFYNKGEETKEKDMFNKAVVELKKALKLYELPKSENDTIFNAPLVTFYIAVISTNGGDIKTAEKYYNICIEKGYRGDQAYTSLAKLYKNNKQADKEIETLQAGEKKYPESNLILVDMINHYLSTGESEKALEKLNKAIAKNPEDHSYYYALGVLFDTMNKDTTGKYTEEQKAEYEKKAVKSYTKAVKLKPDFFNALYNLGAMYFNRAANIIKKAQDIPPRETARYNAEMEKAKVNFQTALPDMEKAHNINPKDRSAISSLQTIYLKLQMYDKAKEMKELLDNLPNEIK